MMGEGLISTSNTLRKPPCKEINVPSDNPALVDCSVGMADFVHHLTSGKVITPCFTWEINRLVYCGYDFSLSESKVSVISLP